MSILKVHIFEYDNYRKFLQDTYTQNKSLNSKFSFRFFAKAAGYKSPSILQEIIAGKKNLSQEGVERFARALKMTQEETSFFKSLVLLNQATVAEDKLRYATEIMKSRIYRKIYPLAEPQYLFFKYWYYTAVKEIVSLPNFVEDHQWIAKHIVPAITAPEVKRAIEELLKLGLLKRDENNKLVATQGSVATPDEVSSVYVTNWHKEYLKKASEAIDNVPREERDISAVYFSFNKENLKIAKEMIHKFREEILGLASQQNDPNIVCQLNLQLFPIVNVVDKKESS